MEGAFRKWIVASRNRRFVGRSAGDSFSVRENCMSDVLLLKQQLIDCVETKLYQNPPKLITALTRQDLGYIYNTV